MLHVGSVQVASSHWIGVAVDVDDGRLAACTTPMSSAQAAQTDVLQSLRRFGWSTEQITFQTTDLVESAAHRLWELFEGTGTPFRLEQISTVGWSRARVEISKQLLRIPKGRAISYGGLARRAGSSPRGVGQVMASNPVPLAVPCHRVIHADGQLGKFGRTTAGAKVKAAILRAEGVPFTNEETIAFSNLVG